MGADFWARERLLWLSGSGAVVLLVLLALLSFAFPYVFVIGAVLFVAGLFLGAWGFNCRCRVVTRSPKQAEAKGVDSGSTADFDALAEDDFQGQTIDLPAGA